MDWVDAIGNIADFVDDLWVSPQEEFEARERRYEREAALEMARLTAGQTAGQTGGGVQNAIMTSGGGAIPSWLPWGIVGGGLLFLGVVLALK